MNAYKQKIYIVLLNNIFVVFTSSSSVVKYLKNNLTKRYYESLFYIGSKPEFLVPQSDFDIFFIVKNNKKNEALNELHHLMTGFVKKNKNITFSFYKGPIKYKHKGLVHFLIYLKDEVPKKSNLAFSQDHKVVLKNAMKQCNLIEGTHPKELLKHVNLDDEENVNASMNKWREKKKRLIEKNIMSNNCWKKKNNDWLLKKVYKTPSLFLRNYLIKYFEKHIK